MCSLHRSNDSLSFIIVWGIRHGETGTISPLYNCVHVHAVESMATCPCLNGGTFTGDACACPTGYAGLYCEKETAGGFQQ